MTDPGRFAPLHDIAERLLDRLQSEFQVVREEGFGLEPQLEGDGPLRSTVRLVPDDPNAATLSIAFTTFPGLRLRFGRWLTTAIPFCGCDACDETVEEGQNELDQLSEAVTSGRVREAVQLPPTGDGWLVSDVGGSSGGAWLDRADAERRLEATAGRSEFEYGPWPRRSP